MFCGPETVDVSRGEAEGNIDSRGSTKHTAFPRSQSISILLLTECQKRKKSTTNYSNMYIKSTFLTFRYSGASETRR